MGDEIGARYFNGVKIPAFMTFEERRKLILRVMETRSKWSEEDLTWLLEQTNEVTIVPCPKEARREILLLDDSVGAF